ncbi:MAG: trypsin-like peptidase domain-containing protein [Planctomycetota bacterium]
MSARRKLLLPLLALLVPGSAAGQMTSLAELDRQFTRVVAEVAPAVVEVEPGVSGICISENGFILTSEVVVDTLAKKNKSTLRVTFPDRSVFEAVLHATDAATRTALLHIEEGARLPSVRPGDPDQLEVGHLLMTVGNAFGTAREGQPAVTLGVVSAIHRDASGQAMLLETSAATNPGQNGGPYFSTDGKLVGVLHRLGNGLDLATVTPIDRIRVAYADSARSTQIFDSVSKLRPPRTKANMLSRAFAIAARRARPLLVTIAIQRRPAKEGEPELAADASGEDTGKEQKSKQPKPPFPPIPEGPVTGTIVDPRGFVVAAAAPFGDDVESIEAHLLDGRSFRATVISRDFKAGLALLLLDRNRQDDLPRLEDFPQEQLEAGQFVLAVGAPHGFPVEAEPFVTVGLLSAQHRLDSYLDALQTDAGVNMKNAGGLLVDLRGRALGIVLQPAAPYGQNSGLGFCMPMDALRAALARLKEGRDVAPAYMGVMLTNSTTGRQGVLITQVTEGLPADQGGLRAGDLILRLDNTMIPDRQALTEYLARVKCAGDTMQVLIERGEETLELELLLTRRP